jgi:hypothetical protein
MPDRNPSPKSRFLQNKKFIAGHVALFDTEQARQSIDTALLQYQNYLCDMGASIPAELFNRMKGAQDFVNILMNLGESAQSGATAERRDNLKHHD